jgi:hypothetical protein
MAKQRRIGMDKEGRLYRVKCGDKYVRFNLDGTVKGSQRDKAVITENTLEKYPFDVNKAIESGIISLEIVKENSVRFTDYKLDV